MGLGVGQRQGGAPRSADHDPAFDGQRPAEYVFSAHVQKAMEKIRHQKRVPEEVE